MAKKKSMETNNQNLPPVPKLPMGSEISSSSQTQTDKKSSKYVLLWIIAGIFLFCALLGIAGVISAIFLVREKKDMNPTIQNQIEEDQNLQNFSDSLQNSSDDQSQEDDYASSNSGQNNQSGNQTQNSKNSQYSEEDINFAVDHHCAFAEADKEIAIMGLDKNSQDYSVKYSKLVYEKFKKIMLKYGSNMSEFNAKQARAYDLERNPEFKQKVEVLERQKNCI
jgi:hypothetical protein